MLFCGGYWIGGSEYESLALPQISMPDGHVG